MINRAIYLLLVFLFCSFSARADLQLDPPEELLKKAAEGKLACREVVLDILANIPEMRDPVTFEKYFSILEPLKEIADRVNLDSIYPDAMKNLGARMGASGVRWLSATKDSASKILRYHRWLALDTAYIFYASVDTDATQITDETLLRNLANNVDELLSYLPSRYLDNRDLPQGYRRLLSELAGRQLQRRGITDEAVLFWLGKLSLPSGYTLALDGLQTEILSLQKENRQDAHRIGKRLLVISGRIRSSPIELPIYIKNQMEDLVVNLLLKQTGFYEIFSDPNFESLLNVLYLRGLASLAQLWASWDRLPNMDYAEHYLAISRQITSKLRANQLKKEAADLELFLSRVAGVVMAQNRKLEGTYRLKDPKGKRWILTVVLSRPSLLYACLADEEGFVNKSYFVVAYGVEDDTFVASQREADTDPGPNLTARIRQLPEGGLEVTDLSADQDVQHLTGQKTERYPDFFSLEKSGTFTPSGTYQGTLYFGEHPQQGMTLIVTTFHGYTLGRVVAPGKNFYLDFNIGSRGTDGILYLTTGKLKSGSWIQLRGLLSESDFRGIVINGGRGIAKQEFVLKKVAN